MIKPSCDPVNEQTWLLKYCSMLGENEGHWKGNAFRKRSSPSKAWSAEKKYFGHCYSSAVITFSNFLEHWVTFYQVCNTITWWFDNIVNKGHLRNQLLTLTLTSNFLVLDNSFKFKIYFFLFCDSVLQAGAAQMSSSATKQASFKTI